MNDAHVPVLALRRLRAEELGPEETSNLRRHLGGCTACQAKLASLEEEQSSFERSVPFERFVSGVEEKARRLERSEHAARDPKTRPFLARFAPVMAFGSAAAVLLVVVSTQLVTGGERLRGGRDRSKGGGAEITVRVAPPNGGPQRTAAALAPEVLAPGERIRIGYSPGGHRFLTSVAVDADGNVTPLYPEQGRSLPVDTLGAEDAPGGGTQYLPGSLEFDGRGAERVIVVLSDEPLQVDEVRRAAQQAYDVAKGNVLELPELAVPGEQFHRTILKP